MKKILVLTAVLTAIGFQVNAQCPVNDSTLMGPGTANDVFYSLTNHTVSTVSNTNWHMAFSVRYFTDQTNPAKSAAIRVNSGVSGTVLKKLNGANAANWRTIDTTGLYALPQLADSDSTWDLSAFTSGYKISDPFNFTWGSYNPTSHDVNGTNVFVLYNPVGGWYKKVFVKQLDYDTMWDVIISNIDNSDSSNLLINKKTYPNKLFVYYNATTKQVIDREPVMASWDLLWTKYITLLNAGPGGFILYPVAGVLSNPAVTVEQNNGKKCNQVWLNNRTSTVNPRISTIGYDWKTFNMTTMVYEITDTFVYFIKAQDGKTYKMTFKGYAGGPLGKSTFNFYEARTGIDEIGTKAFSIYPNPSTGLFSIESDLAITGISIFNMQGKAVYSSNNAGMTDMSGLANGIYVITVQTTAGVYHQQIIKE